MRRPHVDVLVWSFVRGTISRTSMMAEDYDRALEAVRQLHSLGAVRVRVGPIEAEFAGARPQALSLDDLQIHPDVEEEEKRKAEKAEWERIQYYSSGGRR